MKKYIAFATIILSIISCNSGNSKNNTDTVSLKDNTPTNYDQLKQTDLNYIGDLSLGMTIKDVVGNLGEPEAKSAEEEWGADGWIHQDWEYKAKGISLKKILPQWKFSPSVLQIRASLKQKRVLE